MRGIEGAAQQPGLDHSRSIAWQKRRANALDACWGSCDIGAGAFLMIEAIESAGELVTGTGLAEAFFILLLAVGLAG
jgi:hypothetical protein